MAVDGTWNVTINIPMGSRQATLELATVGALLSGKWTAQEGSREFSGGTVEGNNLAWHVNISGPMGAMELKFTGVVDGDKISGTVQLGSFGGGTFSGTRT